MKKLGLTRIGFLSSLICSCNPSNEDGKSLSDRMRYLKGRLETLEDNFLSLDLKKNPESFHQLMKEYETLPQDVQILHDDVESKASSEDLGALKTEVEKLREKLDKFSSLQAKVDALGDFNPQDLQQQIIEVQSEINAEKQRANNAEEQIRKDLEKKWQDNLKNALDQEKHRAEAVEKKIKDDFEAGIAAQNAIIIKLNGLLQTQVGKVDNLNQLVEGHTRSIQAHDTKLNTVDGLENQYKLMKNSLDELKRNHEASNLKIADLERIQNNFVALSNNVNTYKQQCDDLKTQLSNVRTALGDKADAKEFTTLQDTVKGAEDSLRQQLAKINNLENLLGNLPNLAKQEEITKIKQQIYAFEKGLSDTVGGLMTKVLFPKFDFEVGKIHTILKPLARTCFESAANGLGKKNAKLEEFSDICIKVLWGLKAPVTWNSLSQNAFNNVVVRNDEGKFVYMQNYLKEKYPGKNFSQKSFMTKLQKDTKTELTIEQLLHELELFMNTPRA